MKTAQNVAKVIIGLEVLGCLSMAVWCYGKAKWYDGRISKMNELKPLIDGLYAEIESLKETEAE